MRRSYLSSAGKGGSEPQKCQEEEEKEKKRTRRGQEKLPVRRLSGLCTASHGRACSRDGRERTNQPATYQRLSTGTLETAKSAPPPPSELNRRRERSGQQRRETVSKAALEKAGDILCSSETEKESRGRREDTAARRSLYGSRTHCVLYGAREEI